MHHAIALLRQPRRPLLPEWSIEDALRTAVVGLCALAMVLAGHSFTF